MQVGENAFSCNKYALPPHILFVWRKILDISLKKKVKKTCQRQMRKLSSRSNQSSTFALFGGSKMSLQKLSERQHDFTKFPMTRFYVTKKSQKFKFPKFARELALTPRGINAKSSTIMYNFRVCEKCDFL